MPSPVEAAGASRSGSTPLFDLQAALGGRERASPEEIIRVSSQAQSFAWQNPKYVLPTVSSLFVASKVLKPTPSATDDAAAVSLFRLAASACGAVEENPSARARALAFGAHPRKRVAGLVGAFLSDEEAESLLCLSTRQERASSEGADGLISHELGIARRSLAESVAHSREVLSCAHLLQTALSVCKKDVSVDLRVAAADFLCAAVDAFPHSIVAGFLPGVASMCGALLSNCRLLRSDLSISLLRGFVSLVLRSFAGVPADDSGPEDRSTKLTASRKPGDGDLSFADRIARLQAGRPSSKRAVPSAESAVSTAATRVADIVANILRSRDGPAKHAGVWTRHALCTACAAFLDAPHIFSGATRDDLVDTLAILRSDECTDVAKGSQQQFGRLTRSGRITTEMLRDGIVRVINADDAAPQYFRSSSPRAREIAHSGGERDVSPIQQSGSMGTSRNASILAIPRSSQNPQWDHEWLCKLHGLVRSIEEGNEHFAVQYTLQTRGVCTAIHPPTVQPTRSVLCETVASLDTSSFAEVVIAAFGVPNAAMTTSANEEVSCAQTCVTPDAKRVETPAQRRSRSVAECLGRSGCLTLLHMHILQYASATKLGSADTRFSNDGEESFDEATLLYRRSALAALECMVAAALPGVSESNSEDTQKRIREPDHPAVECALELLRALSQFKLHSDAATEVSSTIASSSLVAAKVATLSGIANLFVALSDAGPCSLVPARYAMQNINNNFKIIYLEVIVDILRDMAVGDVQVRNAAKAAMNRVACVMVNHDDVDVVDHYACHTGHCLARSGNVPVWRLLVERHANFVVSRIISNLGQHWTGPVLSLIIGDSKDALCEKATALIEATLNSECDELSESSNHRAVGSLSAIHGVLSAADVATPTWTCSGPIEQLPLSKDDIVKAVTVFCVEEVPYDASNVQSTTGLGPEASSEEAYGNGGDDEKDPFASLASRSITGCCDLLVGRPPQVRAAALRCASAAVQILSDDQEILLPHVAKLLPLLPDQFAGPSRSGAAELRRQTLMKRRRGLDPAVSRAMSIVESVNELGSTLHVITAAAGLLSALFRCSGDFARDRFVRLIFPSLEPMLELASVGPQLGTSHPKDIVLPQPSHAAQNATDAVLEAVATIAQILPRALKPFIGRLVEFLFPYLDENREQGRLKYESEGRKRLDLARWSFRCRKAILIVDALSQHSGDEMWFYLTQRDATVSASLIGPTSALENLCIRAN